jgi:hypothetical protein
MLIVYFLGKFASRGAFIVILLYTCEIFPTGLRYKKKLFAISFLYFHNSRCTTLGICYTFRLIGVALASQDVVRRKTSSKLNSLIFLGWIK